MTGRFKFTGDEARRVAEVRAQGYVPADCGPEIPMAPARGPVKAVEALAFYPDGQDGFAAKPDGFAGRKRMERADAFDVMAVKAIQKRRPAPFTSAQVEMGRTYRTLVERHANAGVKCSSVEALPGGGGGIAAGFMDAVLQDRQRIDLLRSRIGAGAALVIRRQRPSARGSRVTIMDRQLVDMVCLADRTVSEVLRAHGWGINTRTIEAARLALRLVLDRMMGPVRGRRGGVVTFD